MNTKSFVLATFIIILIKMLNAETVLIRYCGLWALEVIRAMSSAYKNWEEQR